MRRAVDALVIRFVASAGPVICGASAQALTCPSSSGQIVADKETAAAIFAAIVHNRQTPETAKRFEVVAEPAVGDPRSWSVYQFIPPQSTDQHDGTVLITVTAGGGYQMKIDRCTGAIREFHAQE